MTNDGPGAGDARRAGGAGGDAGGDRRADERGTETPYRPGHPDPGDDERPVTGLAPDVGARDSWHENRPRPVIAREDQRRDADAIPGHDQRLDGRVAPVGQVDRVDGGPREDLDEPDARLLPGDDAPPERR